MGKKGGRVAMQCYRCGGVGHRASDCPLAVAGSDAPPQRSAPINREQRAAVAQETLQIIKDGLYTLPSGEEVQLAALLEAARKGTVTHGGDGPNAVDAFLSQHRSGVEVPPIAHPGAARIDVTREFTLQAASRLAADGDWCVLNFASAKNPGGGFDRGATAQEESLAMSSGLYSCLITQSPAFYDVHRKDPRHGLYSNRAIFSPAIPFFRNDDSSLRQPWCASVITCPAVNMGVAVRDGIDRSTIAREMTARVRLVLATALVHRQRRLVLGAFGCGVFKNEPYDVARTFSQCLKDRLFAGQFDHIVFAIPDDNARPFEAEFGGVAESSTGGKQTGGYMQQEAAAVPEGPAAEPEEVHCVSVTNSTIQKGRWNRKSSRQKKMDGPSDD